MWLCEPAVRRGAVCIITYQALCKKAWDAVTVHTHSAGTRLVSLVDLVMLMMQSGLKNIHSADQYTTAVNDLHTEAKVSVGEYIGIVTNLLLSLVNLSFNCIIEKHY